MKKLFVDDVRDPPDESWIVARKVEQAIRLLATNYFEEISLDHDIENRPSDETFKPIAWFIGERFGNDFMLDDTIITIHSVNPAGAKEMQDILEDYGLYATWKPYLIPTTNPLNNE
jgi:hypothetical protein